MRAWLPALLLLTACPGNSDVRDGTFVGNPGKLDVALARLPDGMTLTSATLNVQELYLDHCDHEDLLIDVPFSLNAVGADPEAPEVPWGWYCEAMLTPAAVDPLVVEGLTDGGTAFRIVLDPGPLMIQEQFYVDETWLLWTLPLDELDVGAIEALGTDVDLDATDPVSQAAAEGLLEGSGLYDDRDQSGTLSTGDDLAGVPPGGMVTDTGIVRAAAPDEAMFADSTKASGGCGCSSQSSPEQWALLWLPILAMRRRRRV